jgi:hypothetical protein
MIEVELETWGTMQVSYEGSYDSAGREIEVKKVQLVINDYSVELPLNAFNEEQLHMLEAECIRDFDEASA